MKFISTLFLFLFVSHSLSAQTVARTNNTVNSTSKSSTTKFSLKGQWRGSFKETSEISSLLNGGEPTSYVLELNVNRNAVSGYSYTYFNYGGKRYFTICRITGVINPNTKDVTVTEIERVKYNTPPDIINCFQIHKLRYEKGPDDKEYLKGEWIPAPDQACGGQGTTVLSRQVVSRTPFAVKVPPKRNDIARSTRPQAKPQPRPTTAAPTKPKKDMAVTTPLPDTKKIAPGPGTGESLKATPEPAVLVMEYPPAVVPKGYEKRTNKVVKTLAIDNPVFQVDFYDNGQIDGDSISVFFNGKLILSHRMLTADPLTLTLSIDNRYKNNVITMYAENLGSIPPNTALMIVRDGKKRHEVRMESNLSNSGSVVFTHEPKKEE